jgi:hypothetical protein
MQIAVDRPERPEHLCFPNGFGCFQCGAHGVALPMTTIIFDDPFRVFALIVDDNSLPWTCHGDRRGSLIVVTFTPSLGLL